MCTCLTTAPTPPGRPKGGPLGEGTISHGLYSPPITATFVLCGHTVRSVKELIQVKINHFSVKLVLPWWLSCSRSLRSCTNSSISKREQRAGGGRSRTLSWGRTGYTRGALFQLVVSVELQQKLILNSNFASDYPRNQCSETISLFKGHVKRF